jgi:hypothetical protein
LVDDLTTGALTYTAIADTASNLAANAGGYVTGSVGVTFTDAPAIAQLAAVDALTTGALTYPSIADTASNLAANAGGLDGGGYVTGSVAVTFTTAPTIAQLAAVDALTTGALT